MSNTPNALHVDFTGDYAKYYTFAQTKAPRYRSAFIADDVKQHVDVPVLVLRSALLCIADSTEHCTSTPTQLLRYVSALVGDDVENCIYG